MDSWIRDIETQQTNEWEISSWLGIKFHGLLDPWKPRKLVPHKKLYFHSIPLFEKGEYMIIVLSVHPFIRLSVPSSKLNFLWNCWLEFDEIFWIFTIWWHCANSYFVFPSEWLLGFLMQNMDLFVDKGGPTHLKLMNEIWWSFQFLHYMMPKCTSYFVFFFLTECLKSLMGFTILFHGERRDVSPNKLCLQSVDCSFAFVSLYFILVIFMFFVRVLGH